eukprot:Skav222140  [mRNA]  locus=scaffold1181:1051984:1052451:- [translate_table: standard]
MLPHVAGLLDCEPGEALQCEGGAGQQVLPSSRRGMSQKSKEKCLKAQATEFSRKHDVVHAQFDYELPAQYPRNVSEAFRSLVMQHICSTQSPAEARHGRSWQRALETFDSWTPGHGTAITQAMSLVVPMPHTGADAACWQVPRAEFGAKRPSESE